MSLSVRTRVRDAGEGCAASRAGGERGDRGVAGLGQPRGHAAGGGLDQREAGFGALPQGEERRVEVRVGDARHREIERYAQGVVAELHREAVGGPGHGLGERDPLDRQQSRPEAGRRDQLPPAASESSPVEFRHQQRYAVEGREDPVGQVDHRPVRAILSRETRHRGQHQRPVGDLGQDQLAPELHRDPATGDPVRGVVPGLRSFRERPGDQQVAVGGVVHVGDGRALLGLPAPGDELVVADH